MATLLPEGKQSFTTATGAPLVGGKLYTFDAGTNTPRPTYADAAATTPNTNPVILDARGEATVFWSGSYKVVLKDAADVTIWTLDGVKSTDVDWLATFTAFVASLASSAGAALIGFIQLGASVVARTLQDKARERLSMEDLGCIGDGVADDGATLKAALYARYSGLALAQIPYFVEIEGTPGKVYKFATPVTIRQQRIRFIGHGAKIVCTGAYAFDFTQDSSPNWPQMGAVVNWEITGATVAGVRLRAGQFCRIADNVITGCAIGIDAHGINVQIENNYLDGNTGTGILVQSAVVFGGAVGEAQGCKITGNKVYNSGGWGIHLIEGGGHDISQQNDLEGNNLGELRIQSSFGNKVLGLYAEPDGASVRTVVQIDNTAGLVTPPGSRTSEGNQIIGGTFGGSAPGSWDVDIQGGNNNVVSGIRPGNATIRIDASCQNTVLMPMAGSVVVTDNSSSTVNMSITSRWTGTPPTSTTKVPVRNKPFFVDFSAGQTSKVVSAGTTGWVTEDDAAYQPVLSAAVMAGTPGGVTTRFRLASAPLTTGFTIQNEGAPAGAEVVRCYVQIVR